MDYLQEVRRREEAALTALLLGRVSDERTETRETEKAGGDAFGAETLRTDAPQRFAEAERAREENRKLRAEAETFAHFRAADRLWRETAGETGAETLPILAAASGQTEDARAISRICERDARRYDGGLSAE
ncbi:MAG: hypothetical protein IKN53_06495 [Oscillibacter sp.]|nr:hypothetical protein [Oscillibacter sp.]